MKTRENARVLLAFVLVGALIAGYLIHQTAPDGSARELLERFGPGTALIAALVVGAVACSALGKKKR